MKYSLNAIVTSCLLILESSVYHLHKSLNKQLCTLMKTMKMRLMMTMMTTCINSMKMLKNGCCFVDEINNSMTVQLLMIDLTLNITLNLNKYATNFGMD